MKRIAIVVSSQTGHTEKIARGMADQLTNSDVTTDVFNIDTQAAPSAAQLSAYDAVLIGAPIYLGEIPAPLMDWAWSRQAELSEMPTGLFTVSLNAADGRPKARVTDDRMLRSFIKQTDMNPRFVASFAGALSYSKYSFFKRSVVQGIAAAMGLPTNISRDHDMTDWNEVSNFTEAFRAHDFRSSFATVNRLPYTSDPVWAMGLQSVA